MPASAKTRDRSSFDTSRPTTAYGVATLDLQETRSRARLPILTIGSGVERGRVLVPQAGLNELGRSSSCALQLTVRGVSRRHAVLELTAAGLLSIADAGSTNGTYVNEMQVERAMLSEGDALRLGPEALLHVSWHDDDEVALRHEQYELSTRDDLTGIANRRYFEASLEQVLSVSRDVKCPLGLILFDLDHFKLVNDAFGHAAGDQVLCRVAQSVAGVLRGDTRLCRYGGEEFAVVLSAGPAEVLAVAERIRSAIEALEPTWRGRLLQVTASVGVITCESAGRLTAQQLVDLADQALYKAKSQGRNQVASALV